MREPRWPRSRSRTRAGNLVPSAIRALRTRATRISTFSNFPKVIWGFAGPPLLIVMPISLLRLKGRKVISYRLLETSGPPIADADLAHRGPQRPSALRHAVLPVGDPGRRRACQEKQLNETV